MSPLLLSAVRSSILNTEAPVEATADATDPHSRSDPGGGWEEVAGVPWTLALPIVEALMEERGELPLGNLTAVVSVPLSVRRRGDREELGYPRRSPPAVGCPLDWFTLGKES